MLTQQIDLERCRRAMQALEVRGTSSDPEREKMIQQADCDYGYRPTCGEKVFFIGRADGKCEPIAAIGDDEIYLWEAIRNFGFIQDPEDLEERLNLCDAIRRYDKHRAWLEEFGALLGVKPSTNL